MKSIIQKTFHKVKGAYKKSLKNIPNMLYLNKEVATQNLLNPVEKNEKLTDKYKHALMNCRTAQHGEGGVDIATYFSNKKEERDIERGNNTPDASQGDQYANKIGRLLGQKYPDEECDDLIQRYIRKQY